MNRVVTLLVIVGVLFLGAGSLVAVEPVNASRIGKVAIKGYDPVAYFVDGEPAKGEKQHSFEFHGAKWRFTSAEHRDLFAAEPEKYVPQYGGYCAWAVAQGSTASIDPNAWKIVDSKLYLNYSKKVQKDWEADIPGFIDKADENWPGLIE